MALSLLPNLARAPAGTHMVGIANALDGVLI